MIKLQTPPMNRHFPNWCIHVKDRVTSNHRYIREIPEPAPFWSRHGSSSFSRNQNNCGLSGAYVTGIYCVKTHVKCHTVRKRSWTHLLCVCSRQKPEHSQLYICASNWACSEQLVTSLKKKHNHELRWECVVFWQNHESCTNQKNFIHIYWFIFDLDTFMKFRYI